VKNEVTICPRGLLEQTCLDDLPCAAGADVRALSGNALVVGDGNTIPELIEALGITTPIAIPENGYSEIFVVLVHDPPQLFRLHYPF